MKKREFIKKIGLASLALGNLPVVSAMSDEPDHHKIKFKKIRNWVWLNPDTKETDAHMRNRFSLYSDSGIHGVFFESDFEPAFRIAKSVGLSAHRWIWTLNRNDKALMAEHPEWYSVSRKGESCVDKPPYVDYYRWLCPSRDGVKEYLAAIAATESAKAYVDGIHLDYIRYCDIFLPVSLWKKYSIVQTQELPEYDFCYCSACREKYISLTGQDPLSLTYPSDSPSWLQFRYEQVNSVVKTIAEKIKLKQKKPLTAAVFPTPFLAKRNVRQDWTNWPLDGVCPMIYHEFYNENVNWIGQATKDGVDALRGTFPLYAGLYLPSFHSDEELASGIRLALEAGAGGVSLFSNPGKEQLHVLKTVLADLKIKH